MEDEESEDPSPLGILKNESKKQPLAQTVSLPVTSKEHHGASPIPTKQRPSDKSGKCWSFGNMAKAVGCGVSAFGSGMVNGSLAVAQATSSGVIHSSKAVGEGVVQGTKAVGEGVFHSTKAAGRATIAASEFVGTGVVCGVSAIGNTTVQASKAMQDTTKKMIARTETILGECKVHVVLPDEDIEDICQIYGVDPIHLIKANELQKRDLRVGKELLIPQVDNLHEVRHLQHKRNMLQVKANIKTLDGTLTFTYESLFFSSKNVFTEINNSNISSISFFMPDLEMPALLRPESVLNVASKISDNCSISSSDGIPTIVVKSTDEEKFEYEVESNDIPEILEHCKLWYPRSKLHIPKIFEDGCFPDIVCSNLDVKSMILTESLIKQIYNQLPSNAQISRWQKVFCSADDGYSLQNFYRKIALFSEPFLLVIADEENDIVGSFLTCTPRITDSFVGSGKMWLFHARNEKLKIHRWSGKNDYFFQGQHSCLILGSTNGKFGIYIDSDLNNGRIQSCETFVAWPEEEKDFVVKYFECWNFV